MVNNYFLIKFKDQIVGGFEKYKGDKKKIYIILYWTPMNIVFIECNNSSLLSNLQ